MSGDTSGIIFDIKRYSIHDGPGIRTTIFLKGCPFPAGGAIIPRASQHLPRSSTAPTAA